QGAGGKFRHWRYYDGRRRYKKFNWIKYHSLLITYSRLWFLYLVIERGFLLFEGNYVYLKGIMYI
ncbi:MAG: hypothetical protein II089_11740, partial [Selenomonas sp.]|nr:hypothetical protein [Selenomonas sp.]